MAPVQTSFLHSVFIVVGVNIFFTTAALPGMLFPKDSERREVKDLSGIWDFRADMSDNRNSGFEGMWFAKPLWQSGSVIPMPVPSSYNDITEDRKLRDFIGWVWYEKEVYVPRSWETNTTRVVLRFDSANYNTIVKYTFDFFNYAGIHRPVKLYTTPVVYLSDITVTTNFSDNVGEVKVLTTVSSINTIAMLPKGDITVEYLLYDKSGFVVASAGGPDMFEETLSVKNPMLWWPIGMSDKPAYLYSLKVIVRSALFTLEDVYYLPVGIRTVKVEGTNLLINNKPFYFKGFGKHEDADIRGKGLDYVMIAKDFNLLKWLGANSFRTSHYPYAEEIMDMADQQGIVVVDECPGVGIRVTLFDDTRRLDPTRPVTFVTMFKAWNDKVVQFCDVIFCNRYYAWYHDYGQTQLISKQLERELRDWFDTHSKPVVQAEYGADTVAGMHVVESLLQYFPVFDELRKEFFIGEMIWNFADFMTQQGTTRVGGNKKGILTRQRQPKAAAHLLRQRYLNITLEQGGTRTGDELLDTLLRFESRNAANIPQPAVDRLN
ncbi:hypothetical protein pdam_00000376 [Pocillopora damicornis]|uniref:Beta-glucuronidase n=1 Tax=Pocillopora damicornis TaxID=46731 RepID=A0A3M6UJE4_POCDA|nr:hypothetical protein pdam_00000376 [Pocillopora damicornis]